MDKLTDKVAYLLGLAEGMKLSADVPEQKLMLKMLEVLRDFGEYCEELRHDHDELAEYVSNIDEDLEEVEAALFDEEDEDECGCGQCGKPFFPEGEEDIDDDDKEEDDEKEDNE